MKAIILLSGGLDSTVVLALAKEQGRECHTISFDYGQKHVVELEAAREIAYYYGVPNKIIRIDSGSFAPSSLTQGNIEVHRNRSQSQIGKQGIPNTYVPARNTIFLAYATAQAEIVGADEIYFGANALDSSPYPDCRPEFIRAFQSLLNVATQRGFEGKGPKLVAPLVNWDKVEIVRQAIRLQVPIEKTFSCYSPVDGKPCASCDACVLRHSALQKMVNKI